MKTVICTHADLRYKPGVEKLGASLRNHGVKCEIVLLSYEIVACKHVTRIIDYNPNILKTVRDISLRSPRPRFARSWDTILALIFFKEYDRVIYLDADMICVDNIDELFDEKYNDYPMCSVKDHINDDREGGFNGGMYIFNKPMLNEETYNAIIEKAVSLDKAGADMGNAEQYVINEWIKEHHINVCNLGIRKWMATSERWTPDDKGKFIHYIANKPWIHTEVQNEVNQIWHNLPI
jgi:hypothetical protein